MTACDSLYAAPHEDQCTAVVLWTAVRCVRGAGHVGGHIGVLESWVDDGKLEGGHG